jgi:hypothetical protein
MNHALNEILKRDSLFNLTVMRDSGELAMLFSNKYDELKELAESGVRLGIYLDYKIEQNIELTNKLLSK